MSPRTYALMLVRQPLNPLMYPLWVTQREGPKRYDLLELVKAPRM